MAHFKALVDQTIALVKERKSVGILDLAYELGVSPDYVRKVCQVAVAACKDPELVIDRQWHPESFTTDKPALFVKSYFEETRARLRDAARPTAE